jgi:phospholipid/cholesterol/gamma-HCH transport system substrate-binding protein
MKSRNGKIGVAAVLVLALVAGIVVAGRLLSRADRTHIVAYFDNSNGLFRGDEIRILGVPVGGIDAIQPEPNRVKISFWVDGSVRVPADARAAILSPQLVTARAIQLTPAYTGGPVMRDGAMIPQSRTAVPLEWDDLRAQLNRLTATLQPTQPGGVSTLGAFINTAADNLRGQGASIRDAIIKMSQAFSILGDHSNDIFTTLKNLSVVVAALHDSSTLLRDLNINLASVTALLTNDPGQVGHAISDLNTAVADTTSFIADNRDALGTTTDKLSSVSKAVVDSLDDIKQTLHVAPTAFQNFINIYQPAQAALSGAIAVTNFGNTVSFLCSAIQAASRLGNEQSAKLCVQYLAPIIKNRQYNFLPLGENLFVGASARPNELTYSEDRLRPDYVPPQGNAPAPQPASGAPRPPGPAPQAAESPIATNPAQGLQGMMVAPGGHS